MKWCKCVWAVSMRKGVKQDNSNANTLFNNFNSLK